MNLSKYKQSVIQAITSNDTESVLTGYQPVVQKTVAQNATYEPSYDVAFDIPAISKPLEPQTQSLKPTTLVAPLAEAKTYDRFTGNILPTSQPAQPKVSTPAQAPTVTSMPDVSGTKTQPIVQPQPVKYDTFTGQPIQDQPKPVSTQAPVQTSGMPNLPQAMDIKREEGAVDTIDEASYVLERMGSTIVTLPNKIPQMLGAFGLGLSTVTKDAVKDVSKSLYKALNGKEPTTEEEIKLDQTLQEGSDMWKDVLNYEIVKDNSDKIMAKYDGKIDDWTKMTADVSTSVLDMLPQTAVAYFSGGTSAMAFVFADSTSQATKNALKLGASDEDALTYGVVMGSIEVGTEMIAGGWAGVPKGKFTGLAKEGLLGSFEKAVLKGVKTDLGKQAVSMAFQYLGEGAEEYLAEVLGNYANAIINQDVQSFGEIQEEALYSGLIGTFSAIVGDMQRIAVVKTAETVVKGQMNEVANMEKPQQIEYAQKVLSKTNTDLVFADNFEGQEVKGAGMWTVSQNGKSTVVLPKSMENAQENIVTVSLMHEFTHTLEQNGSYNRFKQAVLDNLDSKGVLGFLKAEKNRLYQNENLSSEDIDSEIVATFIQDNLFKRVINVNGEMQSYTDPVAFRQFLKSMDYKDYNIFKKVARSFLNSYYQGTMNEDYDNLIKDYDKAAKLKDIDQMKEIAAKITTLTQQMDQAQPTITKSLEFAFNELVNDVDKTGARFEMVKNQNKSKFMLTEDATKNQDQDIEVDGKVVKSNKQMIDQIRLDNESIGINNDLIAIHNVDSKNIIRLMELGGLPLPSIAVTKSEIGHTRYGDVSFIMNPDVLEGTPTYSSDAWTATFPDVTIVPKNTEDAQKLMDYISSIKPKVFINGRTTYSFYQQLRSQLFEPIKNGRFSWLSRERLHNFAQDDDFALLMLTKNKVKLSEDQTELKKQLDNFTSKQRNDEMDKLLKQFGFEERLFQSTYGKNDTYKDTKEFSLANVVEAMISKPGSDYTKERSAANTVAQKTRLTNVMMSKNDIIANKGNLGIDDNFYAKIVGASKKIDAMINMFEDSYNTRRNNVYFNEVLIDYLKKYGSNFSSETLSDFINKETEVSVKDWTEDEKISAFGKVMFDFEALDNKKYLDMISKYEQPDDYDGIDRVVSFTNDGKTVNFKINVGEKSIKDGWESKTMFGQFSFSLNKIKAEMGKSLSDFIVKQYDITKNTLTGYFESKPQRAIGFNEIDLAVIPSTLDQDIKDSLTDNGIPFEEYNTPGERKSIVMAQNRSKFMLTDNDKKLEDFGEKIGGAKKDIVRNGRITLDSVSNMNEAEMKSLVTKDKVFGKLDYKQMVKDGMPDGVAYFIKTIKDALPTTAPTYMKQSTEEITRQFIHEMNEVRAFVDTIKTKEDVFNAFNNFFVKNGYYDPSALQGHRWTDKMKGNIVIENSLAAAMRMTEYDYSKLVKKANQTNGYNVHFNEKTQKFYVVKGHYIIGDQYDTQEQALAAIQNQKSKQGTGKIKITPPQLDSVERVGFDYRVGKDVEGKDYLDEFKFRGGEFGIWENANDRQTSLNYGYDALNDLANTLGIAPESISLNGDLAIAFGARGSGNAMAHYEPLRRVINLTKMKGAGSLGHEWFHALDHYLSKIADVKDSDRKLLSEYFSTLSDLNESSIKYNKMEKFPRETAIAFVGLIETMKYRQVPLTVAEQIAKIEKENARYRRNIASWVSSYKDFTGAQKQIERLNNGEFDAIDKLNKIVKDKTGRMISKEARDQLFNNMRMLRIDTSNVVEEQRRADSKYYEDAKFLDAQTTGAKMGSYWQSEQELLARAFSTYLTDEMGIRSDYLVSGADNALYPEMVNPYPEGEERKTINKMFNKLFEALKKDGLLKSNEKPIDIKSSKIDIVSDDKGVSAELPVTKTTLAEIKSDNNELKQVQEPVKEPKPVVEPKVEPKPVEVKKPVTLDQKTQKEVDDAAIKLITRRNKYIGDTRPVLKQVFWDKDVNKMVWTDSFMMIRLNKDITSLEHNTDGKYPQTSRLVPTNFTETNGVDMEKLNQILNAPETIPGLWEDLVESGEITTEYQYGTNNLTLDQVEILKNGSEQEQLKLKRKLILDAINSDLSNKGKAKVVLVELGINRIDGRRLKDVLDVIGNPGQMQVVAKMKPIFVESKVGDGLVLPVRYYDDDKDNANMDRIIKKYFNITTEPYTTKDQSITKKPTPKPVVKPAEAKVEPVVEPVKETVKEPVVEPVKAPVIEPKVEPIIQETVKVEQPEPKTNKEAQLNVINQFNPAPNKVNTWIRSTDDIKTFEEIADNFEEIDPDFTRDMVDAALDSGSITIYSSFPIEQGVFVSPSKMEAKAYSGSGRIYSKVVGINDVAWIAEDQGQYAKTDFVEPEKAPEVAPEPIVDPTPVIQPVVEQKPVVKQEPVIEQPQVSQNKPGQPSEEPTKTRSVPKTTAASGVLTEEQASKVWSDIDNGKFEYTVSGDKAALEYASGKINEDPEKAYTDFKSAYEGNRNMTKKDIAVAEALIKHYADKKMNARVEEMIGMVADIGTSLGQQVQALSLIKKMSPAGQAMYLTKTVERLEESYRGSKYEQKTDYVVPEVANMPQNEVKQAISDFMVEKDTVSQWEVSITDTDAQVNELQKSLDKVAKKHKVDTSVVKVDPTLVDNLKNAKTEPEVKQAAQEIKIDTKKKLDKLIKSLNKTQKNYEGKKIDLTIDPTLKEELLNAKSQEEIDDVVERIKVDIASRLPATMMDKLNAWRFLSMLGNPKTHIRNIVSNATFGTVAKAKDLVASVIEKGMVKTDERTKSVKVNKGIKNYATQLFNERVNEITASGKYDMTKDIESRKKIFDTKIIEKARISSFALLESEDIYAMRNAFVNVLSQFMTARGYDPKTITDSQLQGAIKYATEQAKVRTFRQQSNLASWLNQIEKQNAFTRVLLGSIVPFKKTPINILKTGFEYSPAGLIANIPYGMSQVKKGNWTPTQFVDKISAGLTGSAIAAIGYALFTWGFISIGDDDEKSKKEQVYGTQLGNQRYSLKLGDWSISLDWLSPAVMPMMIGAEIASTMDNKNQGNLLDSSFESLANVFNPAFDLTMLQGVTDAFKSFESNGANQFGDIMTTIAANYTTQFVPTVLSQTAKIIDPTIRTTYAGSGLSGTIDTTINKIKNKIPFVSMMNEPVINIKGEEVKQTGDLWLRAIQNYVNPANIKENITDETDLEIMRVFKATGDTSVIPSLAPSSFTYDGEKISLEGKGKTQFSMTFGNTSYNTLKEVFASDMYSKLSNELKADVIADAIEFASSVAKSELMDASGKEYINTKMQSISEAEQNGVKLDEYLIMDNKLNTIKSTPDFTRKEQFIAELVYAGYSDDEIYKYLVYVGDYAYSKSDQTYIDILRSAE